MNASALPNQRSFADRCLDPTVFAPLIALLAVVVSAWFSRFRIPPNDEGAMLTAAAKILRGGVFYQDIDSYPFPGAPYLLAGAMAIFGEHLSVARGLAVLVYGVIVVALYFVALRLTDRRRAALFGLLLLAFKFFAWPGFTSYVYWDLALAFGCIAILLFLGHSYQGGSTRLIAAGLFASLALLCKQNLGIYLAGTMGILLLFPSYILGVHRSVSGQRWNEVGAFSCGLLLPLLLGMAYFASQGALWGMIHGGLIRPFTGYLPTSGVPFHPPLVWWELGQLRDDAGRMYFIEPLWTMLKRGMLPESFWLAGELFSRLLYTSVLLTAFFFVRRWIRARRQGDLARATGLWQFGGFAFAVLLSAFPRADFAHIVGVYPLVLLLGVALLSRSLPVSGPGGQIARWVEGGVTAVLVVGAVSLSIYHHSYLTQRIELERATLYEYPGSWVESIVRYVDEELRPGEPLFVYGNDSYYYFLLGRFFPWPFSTLYPGQAGGDQGRTLVDVLRREKPPVVIRGMLRWPGLPGIPDYAPYLDAYVNRRYEIQSDVFERYPIPGEKDPPPAWVVAVLRKKSARAAPAASD